MQHGYFYFLVSAILVQFNDHIRSPAQPEGTHHDEAHPVARVGEVLCQRRRVLLVVDGHAAVEAALHREYVVVVIHDGDHAGAQYEDAQGGRVSVRCAPVQHTYKRFLVEVGFLFIT